MKLNKNGQIWRFVSRYNDIWFDHQFDEGRGTICDLAAGFFWATLKLIGITFVGFVVLQFLINPWFSLIATGKFFGHSDPSSYIDFSVFMGGSVQCLIAGLLFWRLLTVLNEKYGKEPSPPKPTPEWLRVTREYIKARRDRFCVFVELT
jgi:hypothetical protein